VEGYQNISAALKVPKNTVASIILKWNKFGTTKTVPRASRPAKMSNQREKGPGGDQEPDGQSDRVLEFLCGDGTTITAALHQSGLHGRGDRRKPLLSKRLMAACLEFSKRHLKDSQTMRNKIL
jgi:hypothetical protein